MYYFAFVILFFLLTILICFPARFDFNFLPFFCDNLGLVLCDSVSLLSIENRTFLAFSDFFFFNFFVFFSLWLSACLSSLFLFIGAAIFSDFFFSVGFSFLSFFCFKDFGGSPSRSTYNKK